MGIDAEISNAPLELRDPCIWIDLEMTGLDPKKDKILEIATLVTDGQLEVLVEGPSFVIYQPPQVVEQMEEWSRKQHAKTGLTAEVKQSTVTIEQAEELTFQFIQKYCKPKTAPLCGNAVHHDRRFLIEYMPKIHDFLHYRHIDVSTIKSLVKRWYPDDKSLPKKGDRHRALDDIRESIQELKYYREKYFKSVELVVAQKS